MATIAEALALARQYHQAGDLTQAEALYQQILQSDINQAEAHNNLGLLLGKRIRFREAEEHFRHTVRLHPQFAAAHCNLGSVLQSQGRLDEAVACYRQAIGIEPGFTLAHFNLGTALQSQGRLLEAIACYRQALAIDAHQAEALSNLGRALRELRELDEAVACFRRAIQLKPNSAEIMANLASVLMDQGQLAEAVTCYRRAFALKPDDAALLAETVHQLQHLCKWNDLEVLANRVIESVEQGVPNPTSAPVSPFSFLALPTFSQPRQQFVCAQRWAARYVKPAVAGIDRSAAKRVSGENDKIVLGYLSADYHAHATSYLIAELIEKHDRQRFTVIGYGYGPDDGSPMRQRMVQAFDRFVELREVGHPEAAQRIAADGVNILIDLKGYTRHARTQIPAFRPAPIQVNYLGYPGTMGAPFIDYILVDGFIVPPEQEPYFTEKLVRLPGCYQVNDSLREIAPQTPTRAERGLPEGGFVFCCFNNSWKITPAVFDVWMRLLSAVPESVLWLLEENRIAPANLQAEAQARSVAPERLVFAPKLALAHHLARNRLADVFLDTVPYNAHTTASDALWAGCPVLTIAGETFPSRVAGSLLRTIGLPELITSTYAEYQDMALRLARDPAFLANLRARLEANRKTSSLFDGGQFARSLERAYTTMWETHLAGKPPFAFSV